MPRQAMMCTLQSRAQFKLSDLKKLESDPMLHMTISYSSHLEQVTSQCGTCPKYIFTKVANIPPTELAFFGSLDKEDFPNAFLSLDCSTIIDIKSIREFYACELFISDILIAQGFSPWKRRALETCARKAFKVLEQPCYIVGSLRYWCQTDYLTACVTHDSDTVPLLPPFLTDPTEPLFKKDDKINKMDSEENFDVLNPKSINDFWLYAPTLLGKQAIKSIDPLLLLYQSAEFSQMNISFEIETCLDESFTCTIIIDKSPAVCVEGLGTLEQARYAACLVLVDKLIDCQPIVSLRPIYHEKYNDIMKNNNNLLIENNRFIVQSLLWSPEDINNNTVHFDSLSNIIDSELTCLPEESKHVSSKEKIVDISILISFLNLYAQSSLITHLLITSDNVSKLLWHSLTHCARQCGLLVLTNNNNNNKEDRESVLICKQIPHKKMKAILFEKSEFGVFNLLSRGLLSNSYLKELSYYCTPLDTDKDNEDGDDDCIINYSKSSVNDGIPGIDF